MDFFYKKNFLCRNVNCVMYVFLWVCFVEVVYWGIFFWSLFVIFNGIFSGFNYFLIKNKDLLLIVRINSFSRMVGKKIDVMFVFRRIINFFLCVRY